jgi:hypothetical protein
MNMSRDNVFLLLSEKNKNSMSILHVAKELYPDAWSKNRGRGLLIANVLRRVRADPRLDYIPAKDQFSVDFIFIADH